MMKNRDKPLEFGNPDMKLDEDNDPLDQMIKKKVSLPLMNGIV
jgi:hypothetical protein